MSVSRKEFLRIAVPGFLLLANGQIIKAADVFALSQRKKVKLRFAVASDGHFGQKNTDYEKMHRDIIARINEEHAKDPFAFCVVNGDIVHDDKSHFPAAKQMLDTLHPKYYVSQGNHDHVTATEWESIWKMPVNLDFEIKDTAVLIGTTSDEKGTYLCPDIPWMASRLEHYKNKKNVLIFIHINPGKLTKYGVECPEFFELMAKYKNVRAVFNGHDHDEDGIRTRDNIPFVFDAHFGGNWGTEYLGFRVVELMEDNSIATYVFNPAQTINRATINKKNEVIAG